MPQLPESFKIYNIDDFKVWQQQHQLNTKNFIEFVYMDHIRQIVVKQLQGYAVQDLASFDDYDKVPEVQRYFRLINF